MTLNYIQDSLLPNFLDIFLSLLRKERRPFQLTATCCVTLETVLSPGTRVSRRLKFVRDNSHETENAEELAKFCCISLIRMLSLITYIAYHIYYIIDKNNT